jgi:hypothetical protein
MLISFSMSSTPTIFDVAKAAGASTSAVSFVLNGKADKYRISPATQARIRAAITQLGFQPNQVAISKAHGEHQKPDPIENAPLGTEVDADVPAALAPDADLSISTPVSIPEPIPTSADEAPYAPEPPPAIGDSPPTILSEAEVDADVPAASAPDVDLSSSAPVLIPEPVPALAPEETVKAPEPPPEVPPSDPNLNNQQPLNLTTASPDPSPALPVTTPVPEVIEEPTPIPQPVIAEPTPSPEPASIPSPDSQTTSEPTPSVDPSDFSLNNQQPNNSTPISPDPTPAPIHEQPPEPIPAPEPELQTTQEENSGAQAELGNTTELTLTTPSEGENPLK